MNMPDTDCKITFEIEPYLKSVIKKIDADKVFLLTDFNSHTSALSKTEIGQLVDFEIKIPDGEEYKTIETAQIIWNDLLEHGASRKSLMINLGGGMITDIGGFSAATFKRGMKFVNIPTTLLGAVDAAMGGKTGVNYHGLKNEIGLFASPEIVLINPYFFETLDFTNRASGYAEMVKHALISDSILLEQTLAFDLEEFDLQRLSALLSQNVAVKQAFAGIDPFETGRRKVLNFGHTFGHAFETLSYRMKKPLTHGYAVMWGMLAEVYLSVVKCKLDRDVILKLLSFAKQYYGVFPFSCKEYEPILELMKHDKKNDHGNINFTLLAGIGDVRINQTASKEEIFEAMDFVREN